MEDINLLPDLGPKAMRGHLLGIGVLLMGKYFIIRITKICNYLPLEALVKGTFLLTRMNERLRRG